MRRADELTLRLARAATDTQPPRSELLLAGSATGREIDGAVLEAAVQAADGRWLLFVTDDVPFEEMLRVLLLDRDFAPLDAATIGAPYSTGSFRNLQLQPPATVAFDFIDGRRWTVELLPRPALRLPLVSEPAGVWRAFGFRRWMVVGARPAAARGDRQTLL